MADPLFGVGVLILAATAVRNSNPCITKGHDMREVTSGKVHGRAWKKTPQARSRNAGVVRTKSSPSSDPCTPFFARFPGC